MTSTAVLRNEYSQAPLRSLLELDVVHNPLLLSAPRALLTVDMLTGAMLHPVPPPPPPPPLPPRPPTPRASIALETDSIEDSAGTGPESPTSTSPATNPTTSPTGLVSTATGKAKSKRSLAEIKFGGGGGGGGGFLGLLAAARGEGKATQFQPSISFGSRCNFIWM